MQIDFPFHNKCEEEEEEEEGGGGGRVKGKAELRHGTIKLCV